MLGNVRTVRSFAAELREVARFAEDVATSYGLGKRKAVAYGWFSGGINFCAYCAVTLVLWYGGVLVQVREPLEEP